VAQRLIGFTAGSPAESVLGTVVGEQVDEKAQIVRHPRGPGGRALARDAHRS